MSGKSYSEWSFALIRTKFGLPNLKRSYSSDVSRLPSILTLISKGNRNTIKLR